MAEPWIGDSAYIEWMNAMSSTQVARFGNRSETHLPHWPYWRNAHFGPDDAALVLLAAAAERLDGDRLAVQRVELWLVVERVDVAGPAVHEQEDHALGLGRECGLPGRHRVDERRDSVGRDGLASQESVAAQQAGERDRAKPAAGLPEKLTAGPAAERGRAGRRARSSRDESRFVVRVTALVSDPVQSR